METTQNIDQDVARLRGELQESPGSRFRLSRRGRYLLFGIFFIFLMFFFGFLTRPVPQKIVVAEIPTTVDTDAPALEGKQYQQRLLSMYRASQTAAPLPGRVSATATAPHIVTWTPASVGRTNSDGTHVSMTGTYEIPGGWFALAHVYSGDDEIGSIALDARSLTSASQGKYNIDLQSIEGRKHVRLVLDAVKACRLVCSPLDQICQATNINYCAALYDNQIFTTYGERVAEALPPKGQCVEKTFVAGPKYSPQIPEDYTMCERGLWNTPVASDVFSWLKTHYSDLPQEDVKKILESLMKEITVNSVEQHVGREGDIQWVYSPQKGNAAMKQACSAVIDLKLYCK